jgi:hypothetical protein
MAETRQPGERPTRTLDQPPSARYAPGQADRDAPKQSLVGPVARAASAAVVGTVVLVVVGAVLASTAGLLFVSGATGAAVGLILARARVRSGDAPAPLGARAVTWLAIAITLVAVVTADLGTWLIARGEGGVLGPLDYLWTTFEWYVPGEAIVAAIGAAWGAASGPVTR